MNTVKKCLVLGAATLAFASALVIGSDRSLRASLMERLHGVNAAAR